MPNGNGTGPVGAGPMTGRGAGKCAGNAAAGWQSAGGRGMGRGRRCVGLAQGNFRNNAQYVAPSADAVVLQEQVDVLRTQLASLEKQLAAISANNKN